MLKLIIKVVVVKEDPPINVFNICLEDEKGIWKETFGNRDCALAYVKGLKAMSSFSKLTDMLDIQGLDKILEASPL